MHKIKEILHKDDDHNSHHNKEEHHHQHDSTVSHKEHDIGHKDVSHHNKVEHDLKHKEHLHKEKIGHDSKEHHHKEHVIYTDASRSMGGAEITKDATRKDKIKEPKVVEEKIKEVELHKVQPVVHRDRTQVEVRHVVEPEVKRSVKDTKIRAKERDIDMGVREADSTLATSRGLGGAPEMHSRKIELGKEKKHQELPVQIEENIHKKVEEHIHPVVYKETLKPKVVEETQHIYEHVNERPIETYEVKDLKHNGRNDLRHSEREFFDAASREGMQVSSSSFAHISPHDHHHHTHHEKDIKHKDVHVITKEQPIMQKTVVMPAASGAAPIGHNSAYDAALCDQCNTAKNVV